MTQEFHLSITPVGENSYLIRTEEVATGVPLAENQVTWPIPDWLQKAASLGNDPLAQLLQGDGQALSAGGAPAERAPAVRLGKTLYQALFEGRIRDSWLAAQGVAQHRRQRLRLRLGLKDNRLQRLPWELLYGDDRPLATGTDITLARYSPASGVADLAAMPPLPDIGQPLQVLVVVSAPDDQERLALRQEVQALIADLQSVRGHHQGDRNGPTQTSLPVALTILEQPGRSELVQALEQRQFQVLHYAGHSDVSETGGDLFLVNRDTGLTEWLTGEDLAGLLVNNGIRLAVFNSCRGGYTPANEEETGWRDLNLVRALVNRGVPGVIAMAERIPDHVAITFTQLLYRNLHQGYPIDLSLSRTRQGLISAFGSDQPYWMLPILYLRPDFDGYLQRGQHPQLDPLNALLLDQPMAATDQLGSDQVEELAQDGLESPDLASIDGDVEDGDLAALLAHLENEPPTVEPPATSDPSSATVPQPTAAESSQAANLAAENLLPYWVDQRPFPAGLPDRPDAPAQPESSLASTPPSDSALNGAKPPSPEATAPDTSPSSPPPGAPSLAQWLRPGAPAFPSLLLVWSLLGTVGMTLALTLAVLWGRHQWPGDMPPDQPPRTSLESAPSQLDSGNGVVANGLAAIAEDHPAKARRFIEQLLDQGDLKAAAGVLATATNDQQTDPDLAFVRGRLIWQNLIQGNPDYDLNDALRAWQQATEADPDFLEAWVALGFAYYARHDFKDAVSAWEKALDLDRRQRRDINPDAPNALSNPISVNAYAGLAMAYQKLAEQTSDQGQREANQKLAEGYLLRAFSIAPEMFDVNHLGSNWRWQPDAISDWRQAVSRLSSDGISP